MLIQHEQERSIGIGACFVDSFAKRQTANGIRVKRSCIPNALLHRQVLQRAIGLPATGDSRMPWLVTRRSERHVALEGDKRTREHHVDGTMARRMTRSEARRRFERLLQKALDQGRKEQAARAMLPKPATKARLRQLERALRAAKRLALAATVSGCTSATASAQGDSIEAVFYRDSLRAADHSVQTHVTNHPSIFHMDGNPAPAHRP